MTDGQRYRWQAIFSDGERITQPDDDRYSKHDPTREHNPSAFRDVEDKRENTPLAAFVLRDVTDDSQAVLLDLEARIFYVNNMPLKLTGDEQFIYDINCKPAELIYYRTMEQKMSDGSKPVVKSHTIGYRYDNVSYVIVIPDAPYLEIMRGEQKNE
jgi:hypothetical protein